MKRILVGFGKDRDRDGGLKVSREESAGAERVISLAGRLWAVFSPVLGLRLV